jgi:hypothetical protein
MKRGFLDREFGLSTLGSRNTGESKAKVQHQRREINGQMLFKLVWYSSFY